MAVDQIQMGNIFHEIVPEIAPLFSTSESYSVGDWVIKDAVLYKFTSAHPAGAWTGQDVESTVICDELDDIKSDLNEKASAIISSASGSIAHFEDGSESDAVDVVAHIEPLQDLHGYDSPWPAGGGKNKFDQTTLSDFSNYPNDYNSYKYTNKIHLKPNTNYHIEPTDKTALTSGLYYVVMIIDGDDPDVMSTTHVIYPVYGGNVTPGTNGVVANFTTGETGVIRFGAANSTALATIMTKIWQLEEGSTPTSYAPYSNICPISGFTGINITGTGKNLSSVNDLFTTPTQIWGSDPSDLKNVINGLPVGTYTISVTSEVITLPDGGQVAHGRPYITAMVNGTQVAVLGYSVTTDTSPTVGKKYIDTGTFVITEEIKGNINHCYIYCDAADSHSGTGRGTYTVKDVQIELASTATPYEPYTGTTYPITFPTEAGTVYGGYVDVTRGKLVVDRICTTIYDSDIVSGSLEGNNFRVNLTAGNTKLSGFGAYKTGLCNKAIVRTSWNEVAGNSKAIAINNPSSRQFIVNKALASTLQEAKDLIGVDGLQICSYLANSIGNITYDITPQQIALLLGVNNIWHDANGDTDVEYKADTKMQLGYVQEDVEEVRDIIAQTEPTSTASQNYAVGDYLILNNQLYKVTVAISSGETITPGTNAELITLTSEVKSQGASIAANANAIATLQTAPFDPMSMYLQFLRTYANGSVSSSGRTFAVDKNKITITATGTNSTYAYVNITGSELRTRTGTFANMSLFENDFAKADWINNVDSANRVIMTAIGNVNKDPNSVNNHFVIATRTYEGDDPSNATITRNAILQFTSSNAVAAILDNYLTGCTDFAIYYCAKRSAYAAGEVIWRIDCIPILDAPTT